ncbi:MAG: MG2 domain-containing protein [Burkholderiales bacterium]
MRRLARFLILASMIPWGTTHAAGAGLDQFSPQGEVKGVRQVTARFRTPMVPFGDPRLAEPFDIACPAAGTGRWADARHWVYDFERDLPAGVRCTFTVKAGTRDLDGNEVAGTTFDFTTGGPAILESMPWEGDQAIDEQQVFILGLDAMATDASIAKHVWCDVTGRAERVPVRVVSGKEKKTILDRRRDFLSRFAASLIAGSAHETFLKSREYDKVPIALVACRGRLPNDAEVRLVWGKGVETPDGVPASQDQAIAFKVRPAFSAAFRCQRTHAKGQCIPVVGMALEFTAAVTVANAEKVQLKGPAGESYKPRIGDDDRKSGFVERLWFPGPFPEASSFVLSLPDHLTDDAGRTLINAKRFPLTVRTDPAPPLAKFAARFGLVELNADPAIPVTLRNVEKELAGKQAVLAGEGTGKGIAAKLLRVQSPRDIMQWLKRLDAGEAQWTDKGYESHSVFGAADVTTALTLPKPGPEKEFEVVGIPLEGPGFYVVELVSPRLGQALLKDAKPYHVSAGALVTNLAVHFKWGRESSLVWVTKLDSGEPADGADVAVMDCSGRVHYEGRTDASGIARVRKSLPKRDTLPGCKDKWDQQLFVTARKGADASFVLSSWNEGIATWRFHLRSANYEGPDSVATVFDRTLVRAGDTVGMKHFIRRRTGTGFAQTPAALLPTRAIVRHQGTDQSWEAPLKWDGSGIAESTFAVPRDAKNGDYSVVLAGPARKGGSTREFDSGAFRVEEFRVPALKASVQLPATPPVGATALEAGVQLSYLSGGGASGQRVRVRAVTQPASAAFPDFEGVNFSNGDVKEGRVEEGRLQPAGDEADEPVIPDETAASHVQPLKTQAVVLDNGGGGKARIDGIPVSDVPRELVAEMEYADPNGQILTRAARTMLWPARVLLGVKPDGWALSKDRVKLQVVAVDTKGQPAKGVAVTVDLFARLPYSHRKRLIGGFYAYEYGEEIKRAGVFCTGSTDDKGRLFCDAPLLAEGTKDVSLCEATVQGKREKPCLVSRYVSGNMILRASARDDDGRASVANAEVWIAGSADWWFDVSNDDRMDVIPERKRYEPGETAVFQVRAPFRQATALVTTEREGVLDGFVTKLYGREPVVKLPVKGNHAPNTFVSVLAVRGRAADVQPTALVDLGKPAFRMGVAEILVGWRDHDLAVKVTPEKELWRIREKVRVGIRVTRRDGTALPKGAEVALAAVDEALLELMPNASWALLDRMMALRGIEVDTSTAQLQVVGKRHYGKKALPAGGGGGRQSSRELFDTLLAWKPRVKLDERGQATLDVTLNDSLSAFRIVAVANAGTGMFGTGQATIRTSQDVMLLSGLPPLVREGDRYAATFTVRNASDSTQDLVVEAASVALPSRKPAGAPLAPQSLSLAAGESRNVAWETVVPPGLGSLQWTVTAKAAGSGDAGAFDSVRLPQKVVAAVPVRTLQATLTQVEGEVTMPVAVPADALPGRGEVAVHLRRKLADELAGVEEYMSRYPYTCLEQQASKAVALRDEAAWKGLMSVLPAYLDGDGLARYFPSIREGSDVLTSYLLAVAHEAGWAIPEAPLARMQKGLAGFLGGTVVRYGALPTADLALRKVAALDALTRYGVELDPAVVSTFSVEPNLWPTSGVIDWYGVAKRWTALPDRESQLAQAGQILRSRLNFQGTTMGFSTERSDRLWWLMISPDVNANRALLALMDDPRWREDIPRMTRGSLGRQHRGHWNTTVANAWGTLAMAKFSRTFEAEPVTGATTGALAGVSRKLDWDGGEAGGSLSFDWPKASSELKVRHEGGGKPWATVQSRAAVPLSAPLSSGYRIRRTVTEVDGQGGGLKRGDVLRVRLEIEAQTDMTWVVVSDPVPAGASVLGTGLGGDSDLLARGEKREGWVWPAFEERAQEAFRAYYRFVPKGSFALEYTMRVNTPGSFEMPPTRVEAMYSPELFGESPNAKVVVKE